MRLSFWVISVVCTWESVLWKLCTKYEAPIICNRHWVVIPCCRFDAFVIFSFDLQSRQATLFLYKPLLCCDTSNIVTIIGITIPFHSGLARILLQCQEISFLFSFLVFEIKARSEKKSQLHWFKNFYSSAPASHHKLRYEIGDLYSLQSPGDWRLDGIPVSGGWLAKLKRKTFVHFALKHRCLTNCVRCFAVNFAQASGMFWVVLQHAVQALVHLLSVEVETFQNSHNKMPTIHVRFSFSRPIISMNLTKHATGSQCRGQVFPLNFATSCRVISLLKVFIRSCFASAAIVRILAPRGPSTDLWKKKGKIVYRKPDVDMLKMRQNFLTQLQRQTKEPHQLSLVSAHQIKRGTEHSVFVYFPDRRYLQKTEIIWRKHVQIPSRRSDTCYNTILFRKTNSTRVAQRTCWKWWMNWNSTKFSPLWWCKVYHWASDRGVFPRRTSLLSPADVDRSPSDRCKSTPQDARLPESNSTTKYYVETTTSAMWWISIQHAQVTFEWDLNILVQIVWLHQSNWPKLPVLHLQFWLIPWTQHWSLASLSCPSPCGAVPSTLCDKRANRHCSTNSAPVACWNHLLQCSHYFCLDHLWPIFHHWLRHKVLSQTTSMMLCPHLSPLCQAIVCFFSCPLF